MSDISNGFEQLGLNPDLLRAIVEVGYTTPTPIQEKAIPIILMGRDVVGCAQTGTGKTASFTLPMIEILQAGRARARMPRSLILAPTRELAAQVAENFTLYGKYHRLNMALLIGGESLGEQEKRLMRGVDVLIATPGRLLDLYERGTILLNDVKILVIDEADRMLDMGFIPDVEKIVSFLPKIRQTLMFSATISAEIKRLAAAFLMNPKEISVDPSASAAETVRQALVVVDPMDKRLALREILRQENIAHAVIFCNRKRDADVLHKSLQKHGFNSAPFHGDMSQSARNDKLEGFKSRAIGYLVASDVAARGLDISQLDHVINFDVPFHAEDYVHRIGRTGRAGREGTAYTIATPAEGKHVDAIVKLIGKAIPRLTLQETEQLEFSAEAEDRGGRRRGRKEQPRAYRKPSQERREAPAGRKESWQQGGSSPTAASNAAPTRPELEMEPVSLKESAIPKARSPKPARGNREPSQRSSRKIPEQRLATPQDEEREPEVTPKIGSGHGFGDHLPDFLARPVPILRPNAPKRP